MSKQEQLRVVIQEENAINEQLDHIEQHFLSDISDFDPFEDETHYSSYVDLVKKLDDIMILKSIILQYMWLNDEIDGDQLGGVFV